MLRFVNVGKDFFMVKIRIAADTVEDAREAVSKLVQGWKHHRIKKAEPAAGWKVVYWLRLWN